MQLTKIYSQVLKSHVDIGDRDYKIFGLLYTYPYLDFEQLCLLLEVSFDLKPRRSFRNRLTTLTAARCIHTYFGAIKTQPIFSLLDRGLALHLKRRDDPPRRTTQPSHTDAERLRKHEIGLAEYLMARNFWIIEHPTAFLLSHRQLFAQSLDRSVQQRHQWPVSFRYGTELHRYHVKPDYAAGVGFADRPTGRNVRYSVTEYDTGSETRRPAALSEAQSALRKLLTHQATIKSAVLADTLGIEHHTAEFVFRTPQRRDSFVSLAGDVLDRGTADRFLFAVKPERPTRRCGDYFRAMEWYNWKGKRVKRVW